MKLYEKLATSLPQPMRDQYVSAVETLLRTRREVFAAQAASKAAYTVYVNMLPDVGEHLKTVAYDELWVFIPDENRYQEVALGRHAIDIMGSYSTDRDVFETEAEACKALLTHQIVEESKAVAAAQNRIDSLKADLERLRN